MKNEKLEALYDLLSTVTEEEVAFERLPHSFPKGLLAKLNVVCDELGTYLDQLEKPIDLNSCVPGQKLITKSGKIVTYVRKLPTGSVYDHEIQYSGGSGGTRMNDGFTFKNPTARKMEDEDIVEILPMEIKSKKNP